MVQSSQQNKTVFLGGLPPCGRDEILQLCTGIGNIVSARLRDGYAFVEFFSVDDAESCIHELHHTIFKGNVILADFARQSRAVQVVCDRCKSQGHTVNECARESPKSGRCFECGTPGHQQRTCPHRDDFVPRSVKVSQSTSSAQAQRKDKDAPMVSPLTVIDTSYNWEVPPSPPSPDRYAPRTHGRRRDRSKKNHPHRHSSRSYSPIRNREDHDCRCHLSRSPRRSRDVYGSRHHTRSYSPYYSDDFFEASVPAPSGDAK